jgi:hypothetical protein
MSRVSSGSASICFAAIFACTMSATSAAICAIVRGPFGSPHWFVFVKAFLLLAAAVSCVPALAEGRRQHLAGNAGVVLGVITIIFLPCLAWLDRALADVLIYPVLFGVVFVGVRRLVAVAGNMAWRTLALAIVGGCGAGICYFFVVNSKGYATVLTPEQAVTGLQHLDTLFHASIANMLVKNGHLSTGLDGFLPIKYHVLSHIWLGCIGLWLGVTTLESYYLVAQIIAIPLLLFSLIAAGALLRRSGDQPADSALVTFVPLLLLALADLWGWTSYLVSESYFLSLLLFLFAMPLLAEVADERSPLRPPLFALAIAGILVLFSKISVGVIFWGAIGFLLWRRLGTTVLNLVKLAVPIGLLVGLAGMVGSPDAGTYVHTFRLFGFAREYPHGALPNIVANLFLLYGAASLWSAGSPSEKRLAETFALFAIGSLVPAVLLDIAGGSAFYFANVGTFACIVFLTAYGVPAIERRGHWAFRPAIVLAILVAVVLATDEKRNSPSKLAAQFRELNDRVHALTGAGEAAPLPTGRAIAALLAPAGRLRREIGHDIARVPGAQSIETLLSLSGGQTRHLAVFVAPDNRPFWTTYLDCRGDPFIVPAILGIPMLKGINPPELKCARDIYYTTSLYKDDAVSEASTDEQLCARAAGFGLDTVLVLSTPREGRKVSCVVPRR